MFRDMTWDMLLTPFEANTHTHVHTTQPSYGTPSWLGIPAAFNSIGVFVISRKQCEWDRRTDLTNAPLCGTRRCRRAPYNSWHLKKCRLQAWGFLLVFFFVIFIWTQYSDRMQSQNPQLVSVFTPVRMGIKVELMFHSVKRFFVFLFF